VILVSHRQTILTKVDKLLVLNDGQLAVYGPKEQVIAHLQKQSQPAINADAPRKN
jgi:ATP-binding cassette subfamily C protein EexD